jgi:transcriptional regulator with XRE-family HTH domain
LTQEQFALAEGVTFGTINQWENGRRRPQPSLLKRLLEMETATVKVSTRRLTRREAKAFKRRWEAVNLAEREELAKTSVADKFHQVAALLASAQKLGWTEVLAAEDDLIRQRWAWLRKGHHA